MVLIASGTSLMPFSFFRYYCHRMPDSILYLKFLRLFDAGPGQTIYIQLSNVPNLHNHTLLVMFRDSLRELVRLLNMFRFVVRTMRVALNLFNVRTLLVSLYLILFMNKHRV